ncbi:MAG TPA: hypothetical protein PKZ15_10045, partial [Paludibacteraceae bacterium]|nr:hypothetical protein [Paludibacteraceae bacterium]
MALQAGIRLRSSRKLEERAESVLMATHELSIRHRRSRRLHLNVISPFVSFSPLLWHVGERP